MRLKKEGIPAEAPEAALKRIHLVAAVWGASEEDMVDEIDRKRNNESEKGKRVLSGEGYDDGGTRSHGLKLGKRLRDRLSVFRWID